MEPSRVTEQHASNQEATDPVSSLQQNIAGQHRSAAQNLSASVPIVLRYCMPAIQALAAALANEFDGPLYPPGISADLSALFECLQANPPNSDQLVRDRMGVFNKHMYPYMEHLNPVLAHTLLLSTLSVGAGDVSMFIKMCILHVREEEWAAFQDCVREVVENATLRKVENELDVLDAMWTPADGVRSFLYELVEKAFSPAIPGHVRSTVETRIHERCLFPGLVTLPDPETTTHWSIEMKVFQGLYYTAIPKSELQVYMANNQRPFQDLRISNTDGRIIYLLGCKFDGGIVFGPNLHIPPQARILLQQNPKDFSYHFKLLPIDVREMIWMEASKQVRVIDISPQVHNDKGYLVSRTVPNGILHACSESRRVAKRVMTELKSKNGRYFKTTWVNLHSDVFCVNLFTFRMFRERNPTANLLKMKMKCDLIESLLFETKQTAYRLAPAIVGTTDFQFPSVGTILLLPAPKDRLYLFGQVPRQYLLETEGYRDSGHLTLRNVNRLKKLEAACRRHGFGKDGVVVMQREGARYGTERRTGRGKRRTGRGVRRAAGQGAA